MARPPLPAPGTLGWANIVNEAIDDVSDRADEALAGIGSGGGSLPPIDYAGAALLSSYRGTTVDQKLANWRADYAGTTYPRPFLIDTPGPLTVAAQLAVFEGAQILNPFNMTGQQNKSGNPIANAIKLNTSGGWLTLNGQKVTSVCLAGLSFDCGSSARIVVPGGQMFFWRWDSIGFQNGQSLIGSQATKQGSDGVFFTGTWNVNNVREQAFHMGGSDSQFTPTSMYLDSPGNQMMPDSAYLVHFDSYTKTGVSNWYVTCDRHSGFLVDFSGSNGALRMHNMTIEGRNDTTPCFGALIRVGSNGNLRLYDSQLNYAMTSPATSGHGDKGYVHVASGGSVRMQGIDAILASGQAQTTPILYVEAGGSAYIRDVQAYTAGGAKFKPTVQQAAAGLINCDTSEVNLVTAA